MKSSLLASLIVLMSLVPSYAQRKAVFIIVDGIPADVIEKLETPVLAEIRKKGGYARSYQGGTKGSYNESPTISAVGYNNVIAGVWANKHNVWDNDIAAPNYHYWNIFRIAKAARPELKTAIFSTWLDNRIKLVGEKLPQAGSFLFDYAFDGYELDTMSFPHTKDRTYLSRIDDHVSDAAARTIRDHGPDLSWVYLEFTDDMGHMFGDSPQFYDAVKKADAQIGKIWNELKVREEKFGEKWMMVVTTDHGRDVNTGKNHGGQSERERSTWMVTNLAERNNRFQKNTLASVDVLPSVLRFMEIDIPLPIRDELDGVPFIGNICMGDLNAVSTGRGIELSWKALGPGTPGEVWVTTTNQFGLGQSDVYEKVGEVNTWDQRFTIQSKDTKKIKKVVIRTPIQSINAWVVTP